MSRQLSVCVVGAGPAGLVTCKTLLQESTSELQFNPIILEQELDVGGTFKYRSYENANLVSSKQITTFSDFRLPLDHPDHLSLPEYVEYLRSYTRHFKFEGRIRLGCKVVGIRRRHSGGHIVEYVKRSNTSSDWEKEVETLEVDYVAVCSGLHVTPAIPPIKGIKYVLNPKIGPASKDPTSHEVYHSAEYKTRSQLAGRRVMVLGTGETGHDLAYEAVKAGATEVTLCTRGGFLSFPKVLNDFSILGYKFDGNLPIDGLITNLFETTYVHPWVAASHLRWFVSDFVIKRVLWILTGTQAGCNQWVGELDPERLGRAYVFLNKSNKAMPYINRSWRARPTFMDYVSKYIDPIEDSPPVTNFAVELAPFPERFLPSGQAVFPVTHRKESKRIQEMDIRPQTVIYATGYTQKFDFFSSADNYAIPGEVDVRNVFKRGDESVAFIGFVRPGVGAIPPIAEMQAMFWTGILTGKVAIPPASSIPHYHLLVKETARIKYGVDHSAYMSTLAKDMGAAPDLWELWKEYGLHVLTCYCFGAAFTPFYRLTGPYRTPSAAETVRTELWDTITRRGLLGNLAMGVIPMAFYAIVNLVAFVLEFVWKLLGRPGEKRVHGWTGMRMKEDKKMM